MKRFNKTLAVMVVSISFLMSPAVFAYGWGGGKGPGYSQNRQAGYGPGRVLRGEMYNARVEVLAELSDLSQEDIKAKLQYKPMWAVLDEAKVDFPTFQKKMHEKAKTIVTQAVADGKITQVQGDYMLERMEKGPMGPRGKGRGMGCRSGNGGNWNQ